MEILERDVQSWVQRQSLEDSCVGDCEGDDDVSGHIEGSRPRIGRISDEDFN